MKKIVLLISVLLMGVAVIGQSRNSFKYREDKTLSDTSGNLSKNSVSFFPGELADEGYLYSYIEKNDLKISSIEGDYYIPDSIMVKYYELALPFEISANIKHIERTSSFLKRTNEPIFYNYQFEKETYRFTWITSLDGNIIFTLILDQAGSELIVNRHPNPFSEESSTETFVIDSLKTEGFKEILDTNNFESTSIIELSAQGKDGAIYTLEANREDGYHIIYRWNPEQSSATRNMFNFFLDYIDDFWKNNY